MDGAADEEEAVRKAMANVRVGDDLGADGQEAALKELLGSTVDMSNVDTTGVRSFALLLSRRAKLTPGVGPPRRTSRQAALSSSNRRSPLAQVARGGKEAWRDPSGRDGTREDGADARSHPRQSRRIKAKGDSRAFVLI